MSKTASSVPSRVSYLRVLAATFALFSVYQATIVAVPYAMTRAGASGIAAGSATATFMAGATLAPLLSYRFLMGSIAARLLRMSAAIHGLATGALLLDVATSPPVLGFLNACRGATFGILAAGLGTFAATTTGIEFRSRAMGWWGLVATIPAAFAPSLAVVGVQTVGGGGVLAISAAAILLVAPLVPHTRGPAESAATSRGGVLWQVATRAVAPVVTFGGVTLAYGALLSFAAERLSAPGTEPLVAEIFLAAMGASIAGGRLLGGHQTVVENRSVVALVAVGACAVGTYGLGSFLPSPIGGAILGILFGVGFGVVTTSTHIRLVRQSSDLGAGNAVFSAVFNVGIAAGGLLSGVAATLWGIGPMFRIIGVVALLGWLAANTFLSSRPRSRPEGSA